MTIRVYRSTDFDAPVLNGVAGSLIALLDACLVTGYGTMSITSLTQVGGLATAVTASAHQLTNWPVILISGANESGYNGEVSATVISANSFTFPVNSGSAAIASGTISFKKVGLGWSKVFAGSNMAAFKQPGAPANGMYLRVDDASTSNVCRVIGYENLLDIMLGTGPFPTDIQVTGGLFMVKSTTSDAVGRPWVLISNGSIFYLLVDQDSIKNNRGLLIFGDIISAKQGDAFNTFMFAGTSIVATTNIFGAIHNSLSIQAAGHYCARSFTQLGGSIQMGKVGDSIKGDGQNIMGGTGAIYPNPIDGSMGISPVWLTEPRTGIQSVRGLIPGIYYPLHSRPLMDGDILKPVGALSGKIFEVFNFYNNAQLFVEISDTW